MLKAGVYIDSWKLAIFKKHLAKAKLTFTENPGLTVDTLLLTVATESILELQPIIEAANAEARRFKKH